MKVQMLGITKKEVKIDDDTEDRFIVKFEVTTYEFDKAVGIAKDLEKNLENNLKGQTVLKK